MQDIQTREDVRLLVHSFYGKVRENGDIGPFFTTTITDWEEHLEKLTDFWESNLFFKAKFRGNPVAAHNAVDKSYGHRLEMRHFGIWLQLWTETLDGLFEGELANRAKNNARKMATHLYLQIFAARPS